jgi:hypothetical protein
MDVAELKTGSADQRGRKILDILWSTQDYVIYRHPSGLSPHFSDNADLARKQRAAYSSIGPQLSKVNALRSATVWRAASIDREIARAIYQSLEGDLKNAAATLDGVRTRLENLINIQGRLQYQTSCFLTVVLFALLYLAVSCLLANEPMTELSVTRFASVALCGSLGGFLSISTSLKTLTIDPDSDWRINAIAGASRIIIAVIGSIFVYLMIVAKLALTGLNLLDSDAGIYAIAIAAGFSEKFVPNLLRGLAVEDSTEKKTDEHRADRQKDKSGET